MKSGRFEKYRAALAEAASIFRPRKLLAAAVAVSACLSAGAAARPARGAEAEKLNVCYSSIAATSISTWVPQEAGIYRKYGLDVSVVYVAGAQAIATLISGDAHVVQGSGAAAVLSRLSGSDVTMIATTINVIPMSLVTVPEIATPRDLKGKTFGVSRFGSLTDLGLRKALSEFGLDANRDVKMIQTGGVPENLLFMQQGLVHGALISSPTLEKAKELGYREFLNLGEIKYRYPGTTLVTTSSFVRSRPRTLNRFLKATLEGVKYAKANPEFTIRVLGKYTRNSDARLLASAFKSYVLGYIRNVPTITPAEIDAVLEDVASRNPKARGADPKQFYDPAPLEQLSKEGFIAELYPR
ncbi:MAG TPA: ABC transporter substrate-binding protein [candidate division Zixibacteria bacterium]|nr:ABC transporter substrate-binding protein [candidate division Zixibacteria bacterium]